MQVLLRNGVGPFIPNSLTSELVKGCHSPSGTSWSKAAANKYCFDLFCELFGFGFGCSVFSMFFLAMTTAHGARSIQTEVQPIRSAASLPPPPRKAGWQ